MYPVFLFGTLKRGFPNSSKNKGSLVSGDFLTKNRYPLYLVGERYSPWLILSRGDGFQIRGQVFMVDEASLADIDRLERIDQADGYHRVQIPVISESTNEEMRVYVYGKLPQQLEGMLIQLGPIAEYKLKHSSLYQKRTP